MRSLYLLLLLVVPAVLAGPAGHRTSCSIHCPVTSPTDLLRFQPGNIYKYHYDVTTSSSLLQNSADEAMMHITATVQIDVFTACDYALRMTEVVVDGSSHSQEFAEAITAFPLRFSFHDGRVESLCSLTEEPAWVLNFKRGVLSTFQSSMTQQGTQDVSETDISGECTTRYKSQLEGDVMTVQKVKEVSSCHGRRDVAAGLVYTPYMTDSHIQSLPIFNSTSRCQQTIQAGILKTAECFESHKFRPFSSEQGGAITTARTSLVLLSQEAPVTSLPYNSFIRKSILYEESTTTTATAHLQTVEELLNKLNDATHDGVRPKVPALFSHLVSALKALDYSTLQAIYRNTIDTRSRQFVVDAIPLVGTAASLSVMEEIIQNGDLTESEAQAWFTSLAFIKNPTTDMFAALLPLLEMPSQKAMLGISALVNTYCKINANCTSDQNIANVLRKFENQLGSSCRNVNYEEKIKILTALKALGNAGRWVSAQETLQRCYTEDNDMEVRVAALEAWRRTPCEYDRSPLVATFQDELQDTEVRIAAYLALMTCPTPTVVDTVKDRLTSEGINQVGSFIWTHLTNLQESAAPGKQWLRNLLGEEMLANKFRTDARKFSRNYESSFFLEHLNVGAAVESNLIFSSKSYLPRSTMLNLTLDLFGESINFFEVGGRIEGFESYVERFFGPSGYFPEETIEGIIKNMRREKPDAEATNLETFLDDHVEEPQGSYYMRVFGNELFYHHFHGMENLLQTSGASNPLELLMELARKGNVDYTKTYQLLNTHYSIPTIAGLPLTLSAKGVATLALKMNGSFKARNVYDINMEGHIHPSAAVQIDGLMLVDAHVTHTGLKISSSLHTSTFLDGKVKINNGKVVDIAINTPREKMEVVDVSTKYYYLEDDQETELEGGDIILEKCTGVAGFSLCKKMSSSSQGGFAANLYLQKTDSHNAYILQFAKEDGKMSFLFDTPGSQVNRKVSINLEKLTGAFHINIDSPFKTVDGTGEYLWTKNKKYIKSDLKMDDSRVFYLESGLICNANEEIKTTEATLILASSYGEIINIKTALQASIQGKYVVDVNMTGITPAFIHASYDGKPGQVLINMATESALINFNTSGQIVYTANSIASKADVQYKMHSNPEQHTIHHSSLIKYNSSEDVDSFYTDFELRTSQWFNLVTENKAMLTSGRLNLKSKLIYNTMTIDMVHDWTYNVGNTLLDINITSEISDSRYFTNIQTTSEFTIDNIGLRAKQKSRVGSMEREATLELTKTESGIVGHMGMKDNRYLQSSLDLQMRKISSGNYMAELTGTLYMEEKENQTFVLEGTMKDKRENGKLNFILSGSYKPPTGTTSMANLDFYADRNQASANFLAQLDGEEFYLKSQASRNSLVVDVKKDQRVLVEASLSTVGMLPKLHASVEWDKDRDPNQALMITAQLSPNKLMAGFKYMEREVSVMGQEVENGMEMEAKWSPDHRVYAKLHYSLTDSKSFSVVAETPFSGWEKQDASVSVSLKNSEIHARVTANWKNTEQMVLTVIGRAQAAGLSKNQLHTEVLFTSTFHNFERLSAVVDHNMDGASINTNVEGMFNSDKVLAGSFVLTPTDTGINAMATLDSSLIMAPIRVAMTQQLVTTALSIVAEAKYGDATSTFNLEGQLDLSQTHTVSLVLKVLTPLPSLPQVHTNFNYSNDGNKLQVIADGKVGSKKMMLNINGDKTVTGSSTTITGDLRFITPFTEPMTASLSHIHDGVKFTSQFEMSRIWSSLGTLKMHAEGHYMSTNDIYMNILVSSLLSKLGLVFTHKITNSTLASGITTTYNEDRYSVSVDGSTDASNFVAEITTEMRSTYMDLDDVSIKMSSQKNNNLRTTQIAAYKGTKLFDINHQFVYHDVYNWESSLKFNDNYALQNKQVHRNSVFIHELDLLVDVTRVYLKGTINQSVSSTNQNFDAQVIFKTPWEYFKNLNVKLHHQSNRNEYASQLQVEYEEGSVIDLTTVSKFTSSSFHSKAQLKTPFWQPLTYNVNLERQEQTKINLQLTHGTKEISVMAGYECDIGYCYSHLDINSTFLNTPISIQGSYDMRTPLKTFSLSLTTEQKYEISASISGSLQNAKWSLSMKSPVEALKVTELSGEYQILTLPFTFNSVLKINSIKYALQSSVTTNEFSTHVDINGEKGEFETAWFSQPSRAGVTIHINSPFKAVQNASFRFVVDTGNKQAGMNVSYGIHAIDLTAAYNNYTLTSEGTTTFPGWERLMASCSMSSSTINASLTRNDRSIEITGEMQFKSGEGKVGLAIKTPYTGYQNNYINSFYNTQRNKKIVIGELVYGSDRFSVNGLININDPLTPKMTLDLETPFERARTLGGKAHWDFTNTKKTVDVNVYQNDQHYTWGIEAELPRTMQGYTTIKMTTPQAGWTNVVMEGAFDFSKMPYNAQLTHTVEGSVYRYAGQITVASNEFTGTIKTPFPGWENTELNGTYSMENNHFTGNIEFSRGEEKYAIQGNVGFDNQRPKLTLVIITPVNQLGTIELAFHANFVDEQKTFHVSYTSTEVHYMADFTGQISCEADVWTLSLKSPIPGYSTLDVHFEYDFTHDTKTAEMNVNTEDNTYNFSMTCTINTNNIEINAVTSFEGFEVLKMNGEYQNTQDKQTVTASFTKNSEVYHFQVDMKLSSNSAILKLQTPIPTFENLLISAEYEAGEVTFSSVRFERNEQVFKFNGSYHFTPLKFNLFLALYTPVPEWESLKAEIKYDFTSVRKYAEVSFEKNGYHRLFTIEVSHSMGYGSFLLKTPIEGFELLGAQYTLSVDELNKKFKASIKINQNTDEWNFSANGQCDYRTIEMSFKTPFVNYENISVKGTIDHSSSNLESVLLFGSYKFTVSASWVVNDMFLKIATPFGGLNTFSAALKYTWTTDRLDANVKVIYNDQTAINGVIDMSPSASSMILSVDIPLSNIPHLVFSAKYDIYNKDELITLQLNITEATYKFQVGGYFENNMALFQVGITLPFPGWNNTRLEIKVDLSKEDKTMSATFERDGHVEAIAVSCKLIGSAFSFAIVTPFTTMRNFNVNGSANRAKRSVEFQMMKDGTVASIAASFNSAKFTMKTPFERFREVTMEITASEGSYTGEWRRNDNWLIISLQKQGMSDNFKVELKSELNGWEFLSLVGRVDPERYEALMSGQLNEEKVMITVTGNHVRRGGEYTIKVTTPYNNYREVQGTLNYSLQRKSFKFLVKSSSAPNFIIDIDLTRSTGLNVDIRIPNPQEDTILMAKIQPLNTNISFTSRFAALRNFTFESNMAFARSVVTYTMKFVLNGKEILTIDMMANPTENSVHFEMHYRRDGRHVTFHIHREGFTTALFLLKLEVMENGDITSENELKIEMTGEGNLPQKGIINMTLLNSFPQEPRNYTLRMIVDRTGEPKKVTMELTAFRKSYVINITYNINLADLSRGEFNIAVVTPDRMMSWWKKISGSWEVGSEGSSNFNLSFANGEYKAEGILGLYETDMVLTASGISERILLQWKFDGSLPNIDYFFKAGRESKYGMFKLKGNVEGRTQGKLEAGIKLGPLMDHELLATSSWNQRRNGAIVGSGTFSYGQYEGNHELKYRRNAANRSGVLSVSLNSNIPACRNLKLSANYNVNQKFVFQMELSVNDIVSKVDISIADFNPEISRNTIAYNLPIFEFLGVYNQCQLTISHDIRNSSDMKFEAVAMLADYESYIKMKWNKIADYDQMNGELDIKSRNIGEVHVSLAYNVSNMSDATAKVNYRRTSNNRLEEPKTATFTWIRKKTVTDLQHEVSFNLPSNFDSFRARAHANMDFRDGFHMISGIEWGGDDMGDKAITFTFNLGSNSLESKLTTPFPGFESVEGNIIYSLGGKNNTVNLTYQRGTRKVNFDLVLNRKSKRKGNLEITLTTPYEALKNLQIKGNWNKNEAKLNYKRNNVRLQLQGKAELSATASEIDLSFTTPDGQPVRVAASYDVDQFLAGRSRNTQKLANLILQIDDIYLNINVQGHRNDNNVEIEIDGESSFDRLKNTHMKVSHAMSDEGHEGALEFVIVDFVFKVAAQFEKYDNGFYIKGKIDTTLTPLPAVVFGIGHRGEEVLVTVGYGNDREMNFSIKGKNNFRSGFSGSVDIPNFGFDDGVKYDVDYKFASNDVLVVDLDIELGREGKVEAQFLYDSDGVKARLSSPVTGNHNIRARRSVSDNSFSAGVGINDHDIQVRGELNGNLRRGAVLVANIFGKEFLFDYSLQSEIGQYSEGKLIIKTPFEGMNEMGGKFTISNINQRLIAHAEVLLPLSMPKMFAEIDIDYNKVMDSHVALKMGEKEILLRTSLSGSSLHEGYAGSIQFKSPFFVISNISVDGKVKFIDIYENEADLSISVPRSSYRFALNMKGNHADNRMQGGMELESSLLPSPIRLKFDIMVPTTSSRQVLFDVSFSCTSTQAHTFFFEIDARMNQCNAMLKLDSSLLPKITLTLESNQESMDLKIYLPSGTHTFGVTWLRLQEELHYLPAGEVSCWVTSSFLKGPLKGSVAVTGPSTNTIIKAEVEYGGERHTAQASVDIGAVSLIIITPFMNIQRVHVEASLQMNEKIVMHIGASVAENHNNFHFEYDATSNSLLASAESPYIVTGFAKVEATASVEVTSMIFNVVVSTAEDNVSGALFLNFPSLSNITVKATLKTPLVELQSANFLVRYMRTDINTRLTLSLDNPITFAADMRLSNSDNLLEAGLTMNSSVTGMERVEAQLSVPLNLNRVAPRASFSSPHHQFSAAIDFTKDEGTKSFSVSSKVTANDSFHSWGRLNVRGLPPYKLAYQFDVNGCADDFGIIADSSFFSWIPLSS